MDSNKTDEFLEILPKFGLTSDESIVYLSLVRKGRSGDIIGRLFKELEIKRPTIYKIINKLIEKGWITKGALSNTPKRAQIFIAKKPLTILNEVIKRKTVELIILKEKSLFIGDHLEKLYQKRRNLTIYDIHPTGVNYLEPLIRMKWKVISEVIEHSKSLGRSVFDYELRSPKGSRNDAGIILFDYNRNVEEDIDLSHEALILLKNKMKYDIFHEENPVIADLKIVNEKIRGFMGGKIFFKFKKGTPPAKFMGTDWVEVGKHIAVPIKYKIFLIWAEIEHFEVILDVILNAK